MDTKFSTYHTIRALILEFVEPYIVKLIDPLYPKASFNGQELQAAITDNNLECAKIYANMFTGNIDQEIISAIHHNYFDIVKVLLPRAVSQYNMMRTALIWENIELMRLIWSIESYDYWSNHIAYNGWYNVAFVHQDIIRNSPIHRLMQEWFPKLIS